MDKRCATCALFIAENSGCARTRTIETPDHYCGHWTDKLPICEVCGNPFIGTICYVVVGDGKYATACSKCVRSMGTCAACSHRDECDFKTNPIPIPPVITAARQQGNMTITQQVINPERVKATCAKNCKCYCEEGCNKQCGTCGNYEDAWRPEVKESEDLSDSTTESA